VEGFIAEVALFNEAQCKVANEGSAAQQNLRSQIKNLLLVGILINIAAALFLGLQLDKTILGRINKIIDNARRLRHKLPLNPELDGSDEIKELDSAFHEMSRALKIEQEQLSASESRNRAFIEGVPIGLLSLDPNGKIEIANLTVASMFEADPKSLIGRNISSLFVIGELSAQDYWTHLKTTACNSTVEVIARTTNGKEFAVEVKLAVEKSGQKSSLASIANVQEKYELTKLRQSVLAVVSHELRTPLTSIAGFLKLVTLGSFGNVSDELKRQAEGAQQSSNRLISLVNDILDLEKLESTASSLKKAPCQLNMIFEESFNSVSIIAKTRGIELRLSPSTCALEIIGDSARIVQVMINLLANAIKFSPDKSDITVNWKQHGGFVTISVQDKGPGIPKEYQKIIFERFQQVSHFNVNSSGGTGLGLPICKTIVEQHGGEIGVQSSTGSGSTFWFTLPCDDDE
jgi:PAS domain S-box-containing protein